MERHPRPEQLLEFPCDYMFKAFGPNDPVADFPRKVQEAVSSVTPVPLDALRVRPSAQGNYLCVTVLLRLQNYEQLTAIYAALRRVPSLRYLL